MKTAMRAHQAPADASGGAPAAQEPPSRSGRWSALWARVKRPLFWAFLALVAWLLVSQARSVDWAGVVQAVRGYSPATLAKAAALGVASYLLYTCFDLMGRRYTGHGVPVARTMTVAFVSYAFNLNMGALIGGVAFRFRLYSRLGLDNATISRVLGLSMVSNWLGWLVLAGSTFALRRIDLPEQWKLGVDALQFIGFGCLAAAVAYLLACRFSRRRELFFFGHELDLPSGRMALLQLAISVLNWTVIAAMIHTLIGDRISLAAVLAVLMVSSIAGVITHVPAGLGVLEAVFVALLSRHVPTVDLLAALLTYRALYYLGPLLIAVVTYLRLEAKARSADMQDNLDARA